LIDSHTGRFYSAAAQDLPPFLDDPVRMTGRSCWCIDAFRSGKLTAGNIDVIECSRLRAALGEATATRGLRYHASIPLSFGDRRLGIMNVATRAWRKLTRRELDLLSTIASQVGIAIERARLAEASVGLARVEERARLARDLHDTLTQGLTAIGLHVEAAMAQMDRSTDNPSAARAQLESALSIARANLNDARRSLRELRGSPLGGRPLGEALAALARQLTADTGVRVSVHVAMKRGRPPKAPAASVPQAPKVPVLIPQAPRVPVLIPQAPKVPVLIPQAPKVPVLTEDALYRIAGEALTNVRRHAQARDVTMTLVGTPRRLTLTIADNGKGFAMKRAGETYGIEGMRERARLLGGRLRVRSRAGRGTEIVAEVPIAADD
jgi:two-component system, NarL family, sensor kinase